MDDLPRLAGGRLLAATYRVQFMPGQFDLDDAARIAPYLARLGVSHVYASPYLQAAAGSQHGYDVVNYQQVNRELGGAAAHSRLVDALRQADPPLGLVLDLVPNHMAISPDNPWWWDVLENGPSSRYATYFDVEWDPPEARHSNAVLVPVLGDHYGRVLESGELQVEFDGSAFTVRYYENRYPVDPQSLDGMLAAAAELCRSDRLAFLSGAFGRLPVSTVTDRASANRRYRDKEVLCELLGRLTQEEPAAGEAIRAVTAAVNANPDALDAFLSRQNYRPALWKISASELGYRRFFDINSMIGLRMEDEQVYRDTHNHVLAWIQSGVLDGLRIDHPDGLRDPQGYFERLRADAPEAWIVVEKILEAEEQLPETWPVDGTTGYEFLNRVNGLLVDPEGEAPLDAFYAGFTGLQFNLPALVREKKLLAAHHVLGSDLNHLTEQFLLICERNRHYRDYSRRELRAVIAETAACLPVYRTYLRPESAPRTVEGVLTAADQTRVEAAVEAAKANRPDLDPRLLDFFADLLQLRARGDLEDDLVQRFQQFSGPVMAKGVEDTTFYRYNRFVSLNEVGGDPGRFGWTVEDFHQANQEAQARRPLTMLSTSTHDTKRSEDVRARLNVLSEIPLEWAEAVQLWARMNAAFRAPHGVEPDLPQDESDDGRWPDRNTEYLTYQILLGAWPLSEERALRYMEKACREAKTFTTWTEPNEAYEQAVAGFIRGSLANAEFTASLEAFVARILAPGRINALAQTLLKLTSPGVPDLYQGTELWNLTLVDPDNRQPVDYALRARLLDSLRPGISPEQIMEQAETGLPKLWVICRSLALRRRRPELFGPGGSYQPLPVHSAASQPPAVAYLRGGGAAVVAPRLPLRGRAHWQEAWVDLPDGGWRSLLTGDRLAGGRVTLQDLFGRFPAALLEREGGR